MIKRYKRAKSHLNNDTSKHEDALRKKAKHSDDEGGSGRGRREPPRESYLGDDTPEREDRRREIEITGLIAATGLASEGRRDRNAPRKDDPGLEENLEGSPTHPILGDKQQYDGLDPDVNPIPDLTTPEGKEEYQLQQQLKLQKRNELQDRLTNKPEFKPPGL